MKVSKIFFILILALVITGPAVAQKSKKVDQAFQYYRAGEYFIAIDKLKDAYNLTSDKDEKTSIVFTIAECYRKISDSEKAEMWYKKAIIRSYPSPEVYLNYAYALKMNEKYDQAISQFQLYKDLVPEDPRADLGIESCHKALEWLAHPNGYVVENMKFFNSSENDFATSYASADYNTIYFTSSREGSTGTETSGATNENFTDIYVSTKDNKGSWSEPIPLGEKINTEFEDGFTSFSADYNSMFITRCKKGKSKVFGCSIDEFKKSGDDWGDAKELNLAPDSIVTTHPAITPDQLTLYFVSNMDGGQGGYDLWKVFRTSTSEDWSTPVNLGPVINTDGDEMFPYVHKDGTLYFSSNGHIGIGGLDIFKVKDPESDAPMVENMQSPINSPSDDFAIIFENDNERGYLTSNRSKRGNDDIFEFMLPPLKFNILGKVVDERSEQPLADAIIRSVGSDGMSLESKTGSDGSFRFMLKPGTDYLFIASKPGYLNGKERESTKGLGQSKDFKTVIPLSSIAKPIQIENIFWDFNSADLRPETTIALDKLVEILNDNPNITIELGSHTDSRGSDQFNLELSQRRAQAVVNYLIQKGIPSLRLTAKGYGETTPQTLDAKLAQSSRFFKDGDKLTEVFINALDSEEKQEMAHQINRRTEFRVLRTDYVPGTR